MWLFTPFGFFSVVRRNPRDTFLTVRARVEADLDRLRETYMPELGPTLRHLGTDYPVRARIGYEDFARGLAAIVHDIDYSNFKNEVNRKMGPKRANIYHKAWADLLELERE